MKSSGTVKYENYNGYSSNGLKNKRVKKREAVRRVVREIHRERQAFEKAKSYKSYDK